MFLDQPFKSLQVTVVTMKHVGAVARCREVENEGTTSASCLVGQSWKAMWPHRPPWVPTEGLSMSECVHQGCGRPFQLVWCWSGAREAFGLFNEDAAK